MKTTYSRIIFILSFLLIALVSPLWGQHSEQYGWDTRTYSINSTGSASLLGIEVDVKPLMGMTTGITGFQVALSYKDPFYSNSPTAKFLQPSFFYTSCRISRASKDIGTYNWTNERGTRFEVRLTQQCKATTYSSLSVPFLRIDLFCSNLAREVKLLRAQKDGKVFDIFPTGYSQRVETEIGKAVEEARDVYKTYKDAKELVSTLLIVLDLVAITHGELAMEVAAEKFIMRQVWGKVKGDIIDLAVISTFDYVQSQYGMKAKFVHTGWELVCRLCGTRFHRYSMSDGELVQCPNPRCKAKAQMKFH